MVIKKNSTGVPKMSNSIISHISSPLATSSNINIITNSKISNNNNKQFPASDASSYKILKIKGDDEYSNNLEDKYFEENHMEVSFNSTSPKSPDINPKVEFINHVEAQYQDTNSQNVESNNHKSKDKRHKKNAKAPKVYIPHPKVKPTDVMVLYSTLLANRSASYIRLKQYKKANADADRIIEIRPNWIKGYYRKAEALKGLRKYLESLDYYHQALKFNPSSEKILNAISTIEILLRNEELGIKIYQLVPGYDICVKKSIFKPIQYILFSYALQMQNYIYILADVKTKQCLLIDACWDIEGILEHVHKEKLKVIGAIYTHFHIDHTGGIPPPPYNKYMVKVEGMVKLSKIYPDIPFFIGPRDIDFVLKQNPDFNRNRFVPIEDRQVLTLDDIVNLNKSKGKARINDKIKSNQEKPVPPPKDIIYSSGAEVKIDVSDIKNDIISDDGAIIEKDEIFSTPVSEINSLTDNNFKFNNNKINSNSKTHIPAKGHPMSDYKVKRLSNLNEDALPIQDDNATDVYSNCNLNEDSNNDFENALNNSMIEHDNISNICYDGENSLKFYSNLSDQENNITDGNKKRISFSGTRGPPWTSSLERPKNKFKFVEDNKNNFYNSRINDTISTISMVNIDKKDYPNPYVKSSHKVDEFRIQFIFTPGHTLGSMCILVNDERLFSGDTLLIGTCGRIDLPESSPEEMYDSLINVLAHLEDDIVVYPGHSYGGDEWTTIAQEKLFGSMYDHGSYETWLYELTGCTKINDGTSSHHSENKNEIMAMTPVSPAASHTIPKFDISSKISKKELLEEAKSNKDELIPLNEEKNRETILLNSIKKDEEGKGYFNNHEYFNMNNSSNNNSNKVLKLVNPTPIPGPTTINSILTPTTTSTDHQVTTFDINTLQKPAAIHHKTNTKTNTNSNKNKVVTYNKRKESLHIKPLLQKQKIVIRKSDEALKQHQQQHQHQQLHQQEQSSSMPGEKKNNPSSSEAMKIILDKENIPDSEINMIKNTNIPNKVIIKTTTKINNQNNEINSISSSTTSSDSLSISTPSSDEKIEHFIDNPVPIVKDIMNKPKSKESLKEELFIDTGAKINQNGTVEEASSVGANSYDQILPSSINEQLKSSEVDESYDSENYDKNSHVLKGLSQNSFGLSPFEKNNLMMTELYPHEDLPTPMIDEEDHVDYNDYNDLRPIEKIKKKKSFLNNVFKKRSFERKHYVMNPEE